MPETYWRRWWHLWKEELAIGVVVTVALCLVIYGAWYLFQTIPSDLTEGRVEQLHYTAQYEETHDGGTSCVFYDEDGNCTTRIQNPDIHHTHCVGGCYSLTIHGCSNNRRGDNICRVEDVTVSRYTYEHCQRNQLWRQNETECISQ